MIEKYYLDFIKNNFPKIKTNFFGYKGIQPVWGAEFEREISKSPISLNLSRKPHLNIIVQIEFLNI